MCRHVGRHRMIDILLYCSCKKIKNQVIKHSRVPKPWTIHCHGQELDEGNTHCFLNPGDFAVHGDTNSM